MLGIGGIPYSEAANLNRLVMLRGYTSSPLPNLPGSKQEVLAAQRAFHDTADTLLTGLDATEAAFKRDSLADRTIIHMAVHGIARSPCFQAYRDHLKQVQVQIKESRRSARAVWMKRALVSASLTILLIVTVYTLFMKPRRGPNISQKNPVAISKPSAQTPAESPSVTVLLDLSTASPSRGREGKSERSLPRIPAQSRIELTLRLPIGSEATMYSVRLTSRQHTEWSGTTLAGFDGGQPVLNMHADFSRIPGGTYDLVVSSRGLRLDVPVLITKLSNKEQ
jgi:hypothetical protein